MNAFPYALVELTAPRIGLIALQSDETIEADFHRMLPDGLELLVTRIASGTDVTPTSLQAMEQRLTDAASLFPANISLAAVGYGCTSATAQLGPKPIAELIKAGVETGHVTEPVSSLLAACQALSITRLGLVSPYVEAVSERLRAVLTENNVAVPVFGSFNEPVEANVVRISPDSVFEAACALARSGSTDGLFLSCTNLRTLDIIDAVEKETGLPVLSSNQVLAWNLFRLAGRQEPRFRPGRLWGAEQRA